ncbi:regulator [Paramixta manurensis]|uniref:regulator n=1 Tax=Paramixta manurensis TaxID=2740817 RepID=UPI00156AA93F
MKKNPFYRRNVAGKYSGLKEKVAWQLSKRPMSGSELATILRMDATEINRMMRYYITENAVVTITAGEWFRDESGFKDRIYTLGRKAKRVAPRPTKSIVVSLKSFKNASEEQRQKNILAAQRRARLIAAGLYITE